METNTLKEYYNEGNLSFYFDFKKEGYWMGIGEEKYFIDQESFNDFAKSKGLNLLDKLETYNLMIFHSLKNNKISSSGLENAFSKVKEIEQKEFEKFMNENM